MTADSDSRHLVSPHAERDSESGAGQEEVKDSQTPVSHETEGASNGPIIAERTTVSPEPSTDILALIAAIKSEGIAFRREEVREDRSKKIREWITILLLFATLSAISWQVHEMIKVYEPIKDQAIASRNTASATLRVATETARQMQSVQRAWIGPTKVALSSEPKIGTLVDIAIEYQNFGHEPALNLDFIILTGTVNDAGLRTDSLGNQENDKEFVAGVVATCNLMPDSDRGFTVFPGTTGRIARPDNWTTVPASLISKELVNGEWRLEITGCFEYQTFQSVHHTSFCYWYQKGVNDFRNLTVCGGAHTNAD